MSNQENQGKSHGGHRQGAGRPKGSMSVRTRQWLMARGVNPLSAGMVLSEVIDEKEVWARVFRSRDDRVVLDALKFLVSMRDGRPAQQINVTSQSITVSATDIERAREIVRELITPQLTPGNQVVNKPITVDAPPLVEVQPAEAIPASIMVGEGEGGKKGG